MVGVVAVLSRSLIGDSDFLAAVRGAPRTGKIHACCMSFFRGVARVILPEEDSARACIDFDDGLCMRGLAMRRKIA